MALPPLGAFESQVMITVDFHCHSTASDGTLSPAALAALGGELGFAAMAITDHDNCDGAEQFLRASAAIGMHSVSGVELSVEPGAGFDRFHLLGLGIDSAAPSLRKLLAEILEGRNARNACIVANFNRIGIAMELAEVAAIAGGEIVARPHFAALLVKKGIAPDITTAFERYLDAHSPEATRCYEPRWRPAAASAFAAIHAAGGIAVMAHPKYWRRRWRDSAIEYDDAERRLAQLQEQGLDGLEACYGANTPEENRSFAAIADRLGLVKTAGSDFHGANKPAVSPGMAVEPDFIAPLFERLGWQI